MINAPMSRGQLIKVAGSRALILLVGFWLVLFVSAGTLDYWQGWLYIIVLFSPVFFVGAWLLKNDPALLERRMHTREREAPQRLVQILSLGWFLLAFVIPGLDRRFGWSHMPAGAVIAADALVLLGYFTAVLVFKANTYASRVVEVAQGQQVISTGPYSIVRHPMYVGVILMYVASPLALGSYWAVIPTLLIIPILLIRILNEEQVLLRELPGYREYTLKTRYRLIPGVW